MRTRMLRAAALSAALLAASLPARAGSNDTQAQVPGGAQSIEPGKVGPGSENNAHVSPTSPEIPIDRQPPPEISAPAGSGSGSGETGAGPEATSPPHDPSSPGLQ